MFRALLTTIFLFTLWLLMSGVYKPLVIGLGLISAIISVFVVRRMDNTADADRLVINTKPFELVKYLFWLFVEVAKSNIAVTKIILAPQMDINQHMFKVPYSQRTDLGQTIFANSITLTPGTVSVEVENDYFWVHALSYSESDHAELEDMNNRVCKTEGEV